MNTVFFKNIEKVILANLKKANECVNIAVAWFKNPNFYEVLLDKQKNNINIEIILADDISNFKNPLIDFQELIDLKGSIKISRFPKLMHHKFCIIDKKILLTGSYNWTLSAERNNIENLLLIKDMSLIQAFEDEFFSLSQKTESIKKIAGTFFHVYSDTPSTDINNNLINTTPIYIKNDNYSEGEIDEDIEINEEIWYLYEEAEQFYCQEDYNTAKEKIEIAINNAPLFADAYVLLSQINWRCKEYKLQIKNAQTAIEIDNCKYSAYNQLGLAYAETQRHQEAIKNYNICIKAEPNEYLYYWNRGLSYEALQSSDSTPNNLKIQFENNAIADFKKVIELTDFAEKNNNINYEIFEKRGNAKLALKQLVLAKKDFEQGIEYYQNTDKNKRDKHILKEMHRQLKYINSNS